MASNLKGNAGTRKQWMAWIDNLDEIKGPKEITVTIRDLTPGRHKYESRNVQAIVSPSPLPDGDLLWARYGNGRLVPQPWSIKIVKELPEFFPGRPYSGVVD